MQFPKITNIMFSLFKPVRKDTRKTGCRGVLSFKYPISKANFKFELKFFFLQQGWYLDSAYVLWPI